MAPAETRPVRRRLDARENDFRQPDLEPDDDDPEFDEYDQAEYEHAERLVGRGRIRLDPGRRGTTALIGVGVATVLLAVVLVWRDHPATQPVPALPVASAAPQTPTPEPVVDLVVSVVGAVARPGLVTLPTGSRVADALAAGGGALPGTDLLNLNLAQRVSDGDQIVVGSAAPPLSLGEGPTTDGAGAETNGTISLNAATEAELDTLPGVGPVTAAAIVAWRESNGPFTSVDQLGEVDGIGPARLATLRDAVTP